MKRETGFLLQIFVALFIYAPVAWGQVTFDTSVTGFAQTDCEKNKYSKSGGPVSIGEQTAKCQPPKVESSASASSTAGLVIMGCLGNVAINGGNSSTPVRATEKSKYAGPPQAYSKKIIVNQSQQMERSKTR